MVGVVVQVEMVVVALIVMVLVVMILVLDGMVFVVMVVVALVGMIVVTPDVMVEFVVVPEVLVEVEDCRAKQLVADWDSGGERLDCGNHRSNEVQSRLAGRVRVVGSPLLCTVVE